MSDNRPVNRLARLSTFEYPLYGYSDVKRVQRSFLYVVFVIWHQKQRSPVRFNCLEARNCAAQHLVHVNRNWHFLQIMLQALISSGFVYQFI